MVVMMMMMMMMMMMTMVPSCQAHEYSSITSLDPITLTEMTTSIEQVFVTLRIIVVVLTFQFSNSNHMK